MREIVRVTSIDEEDEHLGRCECGGDWRVRAEDVVPLNGRWYDAVVVVCQTCGRANRAVFDVTQFFVPNPGVWASTNV